MTASTCLMMKSGMEIQDTTLS